MSIIDCPVPLYQNKWEFEQLLKIYEERKPRYLIEIGTFFGGTMWFWLKNELLLKMLAIDLPIPPNDNRYKLRNDCVMSWYGWDNIFKVTYLDQDSRSWWPITESQALFSLGIDWLFIDGDHTFRGVKADWDNYSPLVKSGGVIVFHDIVYSRGVKRLWNRLKKKHRYMEIVSNENPMGIGIIFKP